MSQGVAKAFRTWLNFGSDFVVTDNPGNNSLDVSLGNPPSTSPQTIGGVSSFVPASITTSDATPTAFATGGLPYTLADKTSVDVVVTVIGKKAATADTFCQDYRGRYYRNGGSATLIGSVIAGANGIATGGLSTATATLLLSGNTIAPQVTGVAATSATWSAQMQVMPATTVT